MTLTPIQATKLFDFAQSSKSKFVKFFLSLLYLPNCAMAHLIMIGRRKWCKITAIG